MQAVEGLNGVLLAGADVCNGDTDVGERLAWLWALLERLIPPRVTGRLRISGAIVHPSRDAQDVELYGEHLEGCESSGLAVRVSSGS